MTEEERLEVREIIDRELLKKNDELEAQIEKMKDDNKACKFAMAMSEKVEKQLREQIEKMKCCDNCTHSYDDCEMLPCRNMSHWKLQE